MYGEKRAILHRVECVAEAEVDELRTFDSRPVMRAIGELRHEAETKTRNRKPLEQPMEKVPEASWELRVGDHRVFYDVRTKGDVENNEFPKTVRILRVILKGRRTTKEAVKES